MIDEELSGERKAPRTRVGDDKGIGAIVVFVWKGVVEDFE